MIGLLARWFKVHPGEGARVSLMLAYSAAIGAAYTVGGVMAESLFLSRQPASATPTLFIFPAISTIAILLFYNRIVARVGQSRLAIAVPVILAGVALLFRLLLAVPIGKEYVALAALYIFWDSGCVLVLIQFWTIAGQVFDTREARRLFGLIAAGATLASVVCGLLLASLGRLIGAENLLYIVALAFISCGACTLALGRLPPIATSRLDRQVDAHAPGGPGLRRDLIDIWQTPLLRANALINVMLAVLINIGALQFFQALQHEFAGRSPAMVVYLGGFSFWTNIAALAIQLGFTGILMRRFGASTTLLAFPIATGIAASISLLAGGVLWTMALIRASALVMARTVSEVAWNALFLPVPPDQAERVKPLMEAIYALTFGLLGIVFLFTGWAPGWKYLYWSPLLLATVVINIALVRWTRRQYAATLADNINKRRLDFSQVRVDVTDDDTVRVLVHALHDPDELRVVHAMWLIAGAPGLVWDEHVTGLLAHPSAEVRILALNYLSRMGSDAHVSSVEALLGATEASVRSVALATFCTLTGTSGTARIATFLDDASPDVRAVAIANLLRRGNERERRASEGALQAMLASDVPAVRRAGAGALAEIVAPVFKSGTVAFPDRSNGADRIAALVRLLGDGGCAPASADGLVRLGAASLPFLGAALADPGQDRRLREQIPGILKRIGGDLAAELLLRHAREPDESVRAAIAAALAQMSKDNAVVASGAAVLQTSMHAELRQGYGLRVLREDLRAAAEGSLLYDVLEDRFQQTLDRFFSLLEARFPDVSLARARQALKATDNRLRQMAIELFDTILDMPARDLLIPLLEAPVERVMEIARKEFGITPLPIEARLLELVSGADSWLGVCAMYQIGLLGMRNCKLAVVAALGSRDSVVCEVALMTCRAMVESKSMEALARTQAESSRFPSVQAYARSLLRDMEPA